MLRSLINEISELIENIRCLDENIVDESSKDDVIYELESLIENIVNYIEEEGG